MNPRVYCGQVLEPIAGDNTGSSLRSYSCNMSKMSTGLEVDVKFRNCHILVHIFPRS